MNFPGLTGEGVLAEAKHICWMYESDDEQLTVVQPFLEHSLSTKRQCYLAVPSRFTMTILEELKRGGIDVVALQKSGQLMLVEPRELFFDRGAMRVETVVARLQSAIDQAVAQGWQGLTLVSNLSGLLDQADVEDWLELELRADYECHAQACTLLCLYDARSISGSVLRTMIKVHPVVGMGSSLAWCPFYEGPRARAA